jgi:hypothetical protein
LRLLPAGSPNLRCLLWLYMVFNLFIASGYVAFSGVTDFGDAAVVIAGLEPHALWRGLLVLLGAAVYFFSMRAAALELERVAGSEDGGRRARRIVWFPYLAAGVLACCGAALNRTMPSTLAALGLAAASSFGAGWGMLQLPNMQSRGAVNEADRGSRIRFRLVWVLAAAVVAAAFIFVLGPGVEFE